MERQEVRSQKSVVRIKQKAEDESKKQRMRSQNGNRKTGKQEERIKTGIGNKGTVITAGNAKSAGNQSVFFKHSDS